MPSGAPSISWASTAYLVRDPWYVNFATGQPPNAKNNMLFFNLRYTLPGSAPTIGTFSR